MLAVKLAKSDYGHCGKDNGSSVCFYGNNEHMVLNNHFVADCDYIQKRWHIQGGETPDVDFIVKFQYWHKEIMDYEKEHADGIVPWAVKLFSEMYNIKLLR